MTVVLASTSRYRRALIERLAISVECVAPPYDEDAGKRAHTGAPPGVLALALARGKAESVARLRTADVIIGSDQVCEVDGELLSKPGTVSAARAQLKRLAGREHRLHTAVAVQRGAQVEEALDVHRLRMRALTDSEIADYVARDEPLDCAGAYRVESLGIALFEYVRGDDFTAVIGLPLTRLVQLLARFDVNALGARP